MMTAAGSDQLDKRGEILVWQIEVKLVYVRHYETTEDKTQVIGVQVSQAQLPQVVQYDTIIFFPFPLPVRLGCPGKFLGAIFVPRAGIGEKETS